MRIHQPLFCVLLLGVVLQTQAYSQTIERPPAVPINLSNLRIDFSNLTARATALGGAFIGAAQDETAAPINPAGLTNLKGISASLHQRNARLQFEEAEGTPTNPDAKRSFHNNNFDQSMVGVGVPVNRFSFALFRQVAFDSHFDFETEQFLTVSGNPLTVRETLGSVGNFPGREVELDLEMVTDAISIAVQLTDELSIGLTGKISVLNMNLIERTFLAPEAISGTLPESVNQVDDLYSITTVSSRNTGHHLSAGLLFDAIPDRLFVGAVYHLNPSFELESNLYFPEYRIESEGIVLPAESIQGSDFHLSVPDVYGMGLYYRLTDRLNLTFDVVRIEYEDLLSENTLNVAADDIFDADTGRYIDPDNQPDLKVNSAYEFHVGLEYIYKSPRFGLIPLRFGFYTEPDHRIYSANDAPDLRRLFPKEKSLLHFTFGLGAVFTNNIKLDASINVTKEGYELIGSTLISIPL